MHAALGSEELSLPFAFNGILASFNFLLILFGPL
jgi:hypothetical protein